jgi:hypothetical protein
MDRPETSADARWPRLMKRRRKKWEENDDDAPLQLYETEGEQSEKFARDDFEGKFTAQELEIAYAFAYRSKYAHKNQWGKKSGLAQVQSESSGGENLGDMADPDME